MGMINVPAAFTPQIKLTYPQDNTIIFEKYFYDQFRKDRPLNLSRVYLPVQWTSFYVNNNFGRSSLSIFKLQRWLNTLDKRKKYFTIVQFDDGILNKISSLDIKVYAMSGSRIDYPLPLLCTPHEFQFKNKRTFLANFIGRNTHPIRKELLKRIPEGSNYLCSTSNFSLKDFCNVLSRSVFTLCPRGYGITSFRIAEAMQYGSIPVYISDKFIFPHSVDFSKYGIIITPAQVLNIDKILKSYSSDQILKLQKNVKSYYRKYFLYDQNYKLIINDLKRP